MENKNEAQIRANKKWSKGNREHSNYLKNRSACKCFIKNKATHEDLEELQLLILQTRLQKSLEGETINE